ncbi:winged helix-turn-helix domain-containing protein, partial [Pseudomonas aeruginosa]|nr:YcaQ family DNA glycosylase [Pseudomonas aeruginosa]
MTAPFYLSSSEATHQAMAAQGFGCVTPPHQLQIILQHLGALQIDSVCALIRSHYLPLYSRIGHYERAELDRLAWGSGRERALFEYWGHEASLMPLALYPLLQWRMQRARIGRGIHKQIIKFGHEQQPLIQQVLKSIVDRGALTAGDLAKRDKPGGSWWDWSAEKLALEWLFAVGELTVSRGRGFERRYDLPERVIPESILNHPTITEGEAHRRLLMHAANALGVATEQDLRDYFRLDAIDTRLRLSELVEDGQLSAVLVDGWIKPAWMTKGLSQSKSRKPSALLSPFDSLIWSRERTERLFDFRYRLEFYQPPSKRVYGYYVMPFLFRGQLVGRVDVRAERAQRRLTVHAVHEEKIGLSDAALSELALQLQSLAKWLGLEAVLLNCKRPVAQRLLATGLLA